VAIENSPAERAKMNGLDPQAYLLDRIHDHKANRLDKLLP
jgi:hypothetical protein